MRSFENIGDDPKNNQNNEQIPQVAPRRIKELIEQSKNLSDMAGFSIIAPLHDLNMS